MCLDHIILSKASLLLQIINVLSQVVLYHSLILKHFAEVMHVCCFELRSVQEAICQFVESFWLLFEKFDIKNGFWRRQIIFLQIIVEPSSWRSEIGDTGSNTDAGTSHNHNLLVLFVFESFQELLFGEARPLTLISVGVSHQSWSHLQIDFFK